MVIMSLSSGDAELGGVDYVRTIAETAKILGVSTLTLRRMIRDGSAPTVTQLSERRLGIRDSHRIAWLEARRVGAVAEARI
jgi:predicted site-specific integrase-resolvase